jgi:hypothetical protein
MGARGSCSGMFTVTMTVWNDRIKAVCVLQQIHTNCRSPWLMTHTTFWFPRSVSMALTLWPQPNRARR